jgi:hypothetical protein
MYASVRKYLMDPDRIDELMHRVDEEFCPRLEEMPGFVAYQVIDTGRDRGGKGVVFTVTVCHDRESADRTIEMAADFVADELAGFGIERLEAAAGEVKVSRAASEMLEASHA